jgi:hypothetical protein
MRRPLFKREFGLVEVALAVDDFVGVNQLDLRAVSEPPQESGTQEAVLDDPAHRGRFGSSGCRLAMIEMQEQRTGTAVVACIGDANIEDWLGFGRDLLPCVQCGEQALAGIRHGRGAAIERGLAHGGERHAINQGGGEPRFGGGQRQQATVEAGAHYRKIEPILIHPP